MLDMDTNTDAMSNALLHMRQQLTDSHRQITLLNEENARLKTLCQSTTNTPNGTTTHTDSSSIVSTTTNTNNNNAKLPQKRAHSSNRTTQSVVTTNKIKTTTTNLYDVDETTSPPSLPISLPSNEIMDIETNSTNNNIYNNNNNNEHLKRTNPLENGINITP